MSRGDGKNLRFYHRKDENIVTEKYNILIDLYNKNTSLSVDLSLTREYNGREVVFEGRGEKNEEEYED